MLLKSISISMLLAQPLAAASLDGLQEKCWPWSSPEGWYIGSRHVLLNSDRFWWVNIIYPSGCARSDVWLGILLYFLNKLPDLYLYVNQVHYESFQWCNRKDKMAHDAPAVPTPTFHQCIKVQRMSSLLQHHLLFWGHWGWCCTIARMRSRVCLYICMYIDMYHWVPII